MVWGIGILLIVAGVLVLIYAIQGQWPIAHIYLPGPADGEPRRTPGVTPGEPRRAPVGG